MEGWHTLTCAQLPGGSAQPQSPATDATHSPTKIPAALPCLPCPACLPGLVEEEWLTTLSAVAPEDVRFLDFVEEGHRLAAQLRVSVYWKVWVGGWAGG